MERPHTYWGFVWLPVILMLVFWADWSGSLKGLQNALNEQRIQLYERPASQDILTYRSTRPASTGWACGPGRAARPRKSSTVCCLPALPISYLTWTSVGFPHHRKTSCLNLHCDGPATEPSFRFGSFQLRRDLADLHCRFQLCTAQPDWRFPMCRPGRRLRTRPALRTIGQWSFCFVSGDFSERRRG